MLVANILALKLGLPMTDLEGFKAGRLIASGKRLSKLDHGQFFDKPRRILVVDDSISSGKAILQAKEALKKVGEKHSLTYGVAYVVGSGREHCDTYAELVANPRRFEWNILANSDIEDYCFDMDGVFCVDPTPEENDDGPRYQEFLRNARPLLLPPYSVGTIVTSRLHKYRVETETWLKAWGVCYKRLEMLPLDSKEERIRTDAAAPFKAKIYQRSGSLLFVESDPKQAGRIASLSGKFVYCTGDCEFYRPGQVRSALEHNRVKFRRKLRRYIRRLTRIFKKHS